MGDEQKHDNQPQAPLAEVPVAPPQTWPAQTSAAQPLANPSAEAPLMSAPTSSNAIVALILAILSWAVCPIIAAIVALVFASMASTEINASGGRIGGRGLVTAARIVAWIHIGVMAAAILIGLLIVVVVVIASSSTIWPTH
jgi:hypothetical protein